MAYWCLIGSPLANWSHRTEHVDCICSVGAFWSILIELTYKGYNLLCDADKTNKEKSEMYRPVQFMDVDY